MSGNKIKTLNDDKIVDPDNKSIYLPLSIQTSHSLFQKENEIWREKSLQKQ